VAEHVVARVGDIPDGGSLIVELEGRSIGVFHFRGEFFAVRNRCVHQGGPLCDGAVLSALRAEVLPTGKVREYWDDSTPVVACPWHGWEYDLRTGDLLGDKSRRIAVYETRVEDGEIRVLM
jgi:nitrite reductase/ring-hydroxylating ferredoxin subunit